jgi:hypothetical protein
MSPNAGFPGDTSVFPTTTELVVGPGTQETFFPPYPEKQNSTILAADVQ